MRVLTARGAYNPFGGGRKRFFAAPRRSDVSVIWAAILWLGAVAAGVGMVLSEYSLPSWWIVLGLAAISGFAERHSVTLTGDRQRGIEISVSFLPFVFTAVAFGPLAAFAVGALANLADLRPPYLRWAVYTPARAFTGAAAGFAALAAGAGSPDSFTAILITSSVAAVTCVGADIGFNMATLAARGSASPFTYPRTLVPLFVLALPLYVPAVAFLVYGYEKYSFVVVAVCLVPVLALQRVVHLYQEERRAREDLSSMNQLLERANLSFAAALVATLDARDRYTAGHSAAVAIYSRDIAERMALSESDQRMAHLAGLVHDIGKIGLPPGLLEKVGPLTLEERRTMQQHSEIGERILANVENYAEIAEIVRHHHERIDGHGYPDGRVGEDIPLIARIIAVADAYNAMTSDRPYREAMPSAVARMRLAQAVGSQFDTSVVAAFEAILATSDEAYKTGTRPDFDFSGRVPTVDLVAVGAA